MKLSVMAKEAIFVKMITNNCRNQKCSLGLDWSDL
jgi:hypothetical protein